MNELFRAAKDIEWWEEMCHESNRPGVLDSAVLLKDHFLATHDRKDDLPLSREWLVNLNGWIAEANFLWFEPEELPEGVTTIRVGKNVNSDDPRISWGLTIVTRDWHMQGFITSRGQLRKLCAAAGHQLENGK